jgi:hypothetical protein
MTDSGYKITSVIFGDEMLEVGFFEQHEQSPDVIDVKQRLIRSDLFSNEIEAILDDLADILDKAAIHRRNPVQQFRNPKRFEADE